MIQQKNFSISLLIIINLLFMMFMITSCKEDKNTPVPNDMIAYYPFNGNAIDESGNGFDGFLSGGVTLSTDRFGNENSAFEFDGIDDVIYIQHAEEINLDGYTDDYSFSLWFQTNNPTNIAESSSRLIEKWNLSNGTAYPISVQMFDDSIRCIVFDAINLNGPTHIVTNGSYVSEWHHFVFINDIESDQSKIYINGDLKVAVENKTTGSTTNNYDYTIGNNLRLDRGFPGKIDDLRIFDRVLSESEIDALYAED